jgi:hypothetical protein
VAIFLALAGCDSTVEAPDDAVACAGIQCTAGQCVSNAGQPMCRCGPWEEAAGVPCDVAGFVVEDDHGGSPEVASELPMSPGRREGRISASVQGMADRDLFSFSAREGHSYVFICEPVSLPGCFPRLLDATGQHVSGRPLDTRRTSWLFSALPEGRWYVEVSGAGGTGTYAYQLLDTGVDDHANVMEKATALEPSQRPFTVVSSFMGDSDVIRFHARAGHGYRFRCELPPGAGVSLRLIDSGGRQLATSEGLGTVRVPELDLKPSLDADWFVEVVASYGPLPATYTCTLTDLGQDEHADSVQGATPMTPGVPSSVRMHSRLDVDMLAFTAEQGRFYALRQVPAGRLVVRLADASGQLVHMLNEGPFVPTHYWGGDYHLVVTHAPGAPLDGPVQLVLEDLGVDDFGQGFHGNYALYSPGQSVTGRFHFASDVDAVAFRVEADGVYQVTCQPDCVVASSVLGGHDRPVPLTTRTFDVRDGGYADFRVWRHSAQETFTLRVERVGTDDHGELGWLAPVLALPASASGLFEASNDQEAFAVDLQGGRPYRVLTQPSTRVMLQGPSGSFVWSNQGLFTPWQTGRHILWIQPEDPERFGPWNFTFQAE